MKIIEIRELPVDIFRSIKISHAGVNPCLKKSEPGETRVLFELYSMFKPARKVKNMQNTAQMIPIAV
jgi:hypothetical protein